jgi:hypothetical protein
MQQERGPLNKTSLAWQLSGAPLDAIKLFAAILMLGDHVNTILFHGNIAILWSLGRAAFPLFCFALSCNLARGTNSLRYFQTLILFGVVTQPIHGAAFTGNFANVLFTLAVGAVVAAALQSVRLALQHAAFAVGVAAIFWTSVRARTGLEFGLAGALFPAAILLVLEGRWTHLPWLLCCLVGLNWNPDGLSSEGWPVVLARNAAFAGLGSLIVIAAACTLRAWPRFMPRFALHIFYPAHLAVLVIAHRLWG